MRAQALVLASLCTACGLPPAGELGQDAVCDGETLDPQQFGVARLMIDTRGLPPGRLLHQQCGSVSRAPEAIVRYVVPGEPDQPVAVRAGADNGGTDTDYYTHVGIFESCPPGEPETVMCGLPNGTIHLYSEGLYAGGDVIWIAISANEGALPWEEEMPLEGLAQLEVRSSAVHRPELDSARVRVDDQGGYWFDVVGRDRDRDVSSVLVTFLDESGIPIPRVEGASPTLFADEYFIEHPDDSAEIDLRLLRTQVDRVLPLGPDALVRLEDELGLVSPPLRVPVENVTRRELGEPCDETSDSICRQELACEGGRCVPTVDRGALCDFAERTPILLPEPAGARASSLPPIERTMSERNLFTASCSSRGGGDAVYLVTVPDVRADLVIETRPTPAGALAIYRRVECLDPRTERECVNGETGIGRVEAVTQDIVPGNHAIFVDDNSEAARSVSTTFTLRPLLDPGAACDPSEVDNRCLAGACNPTTSICP